MLPRKTIESPTPSVTSPSSSMTSQFTAEHRDHVQGGVGVQVRFCERVAVRGRHGEDPNDGSFGRCGRPQCPLGLRPIVRLSGDTPLLPQLLQQDPVGEQGAR